jgi:hypothetical protein
MRPLCREHPPQSPEHVMIRNLGRQHFGLSLDLVEGEAAAKT